MEGWGAEAPSDSRGFRQIPREEGDGERAGASGGEKEGVGRKKVVRKEAGRPNCTICGWGPRQA